MNNRIPDYPPPQRALDGSEPLAAWQDGQQRSLPILAVAEVALEQVRKELDPNQSAYASWLLLPGNAGKSIEEFLASLKGKDGLDTQNLLWKQPFEGMVGDDTFVTALDFTFGDVVVVLGGSELLDSDFTTPNSKTVVLNFPLANPGWVVIKAFSPPDGEQPNIYQRPGSAIIRRTKGKLVDVLSPLDYIPASLHDGIINPVAGVTPEPVAAYFQAALDINPGDALVMPRGTFGIEAEVFTNGKDISGAGWANTDLIALTAGMRSVLYYAGQNCRLENFHIAADLALQGILTRGCNLSNVTRVGIDGAQIAGIAFPETGNNSLATVENSLIRFSGKRYACGTTTINNGQTTATIVGANPSTLPTSAGAGPRIGLDFVQIGTTPGREITAIGPDFISFFPAIESDQAGMAVTILQGSNAEVRRNGDNSNIKFFGNALQYAALAGIDCQSLYGIQERGNACEFNHYRFIIGRRAAGGEVRTINSEYDVSYGEADGGGAGFYHGSSRELCINNPQTDGIANNGLDVFRMADPHTLLNPNFLIQGVRCSKREIFENPTDVLVNIGTTAFIRQPAPTSPFTVTLLAPPSPTNASNLATWTDIVTKLVFGDLNGNTATIRCADFKINGQPFVGGFSSVTVSGDNREFHLRYIGSIGWFLTGSPSL